MADAPCDVDLDDFLDNLKRQLRDLGTYHTATDIAHSMSAYRSDESRRRTAKPPVLPVADTLSGYAYPASRGDYDETFVSMADHFIAATCRPSELPVRHFCEHCGDIARYRCLECGASSCSLACSRHHTEGARCGRNQDYNRGIQ
jgi:hypothetical protein